MSVAWLFLVKSPGDSATKGWLKPEVFVSAVVVLAIRRTSLASFVVSGCGPAPAIFRYAAHLLPITLSFPHAWRELNGGDTVG